MCPNNKLPETVKKRVEHLRSSYEAHLAAAKRLAEADGGRIFGLDLLAQAVLNRSLSLIDGFTLMIETRNLLCAGSLLRLQVDSLLRFFACSLVDNPHNLVEPLLRGEPLRKLRSKAGQPLTDKLLREELSKVYPWVDSVYKATSGFIHLSRPHMLSTINYLSEEDRTLTIAVGRNAHEVRECELLEAADAFIEATKCLFEVVCSWIARKEGVGERRPKT